MWVQRAVRELILPLRREPSEEEQRAIKRHKQPLNLVFDAGARSHSHTTKNDDAARAGYRAGADATLRAGVGVGGRRLLNREEQP